eukprot:1788421-Rhodomonas_salina.1
MSKIQYPVEIPGTAINVSFETAVLVAVLHLLSLTYCLQFDNLEATHTGVLSPGTPARGYHTGVRRLSSPRGVHEPTQVGIPTGTQVPGVPAGPGTHVYRTAVGGVPGCPGTWVPWYPGYPGIRVGPGWSSEHKHTHTHRCVQSPKIKAGLVSTDTLHTVCGGDPDTTRHFPPVRLEACV